MSELGQPDELDVLMQRVRADVEARKARAVAAETQAVVGSAGASALPAPVDAARARYSATELLAFYDVVFLRAAHIAVLGREPDGEVAARLLQQLRLGDIGRVQVIDILRASDEAQARGAVITGLTRERFADGVRRSMAGRKLAALLRISRNIPRLASYMRQVISRVDTTERKMAQLEARLNEVQAAHGAVEEQLRAQVETLSRRVLELEGHSDAAANAGQHEQN